MWEESALHINHKKGRADKCKINMQTIQIRVAQWLQMHEWMAPDEPHEFLKIHLERIIYKTLKSIYLE